MLGHSRFYFIFDELTVPFLDESKISKIASFDCGLLMWLFEDYLNAISYKQSAGDSITFIIIGLELTEALPLAVTLKIISYLPNLEISMLTVLHGFVFACSSHPD